MNNLGTISRVIQHIEKEFPNESGPLLELALKSKDGSCKSRLLYVRGVNEPDGEVVRSISEQIPEEDFTIEVDLQEKKNFIRKYALSNRPSLDANWRGRLFDAEEFARSDNKRDFLLKSYWRIIINRDDTGRYYTRHDIYPCFWNPGFSVPGENDFKDTVANILSGFNKRREFLIDERYDYLKIFVKTGANYDPIRLGENELQDIFERQFNGIHNLDDFSRNVVIPRLELKFGA